MSAGTEPGILATWILGLGACLSLLTLPVWGSLPVLLSLLHARIGAGFGTTLAFQAILSSLLMLPPAACFGALLPALTQSLKEAGKSSGQVAGTGYALDSAGSVLGGILGVFLALPLLGVESLFRWAIVGEISLFLLLSLAPRRSEAPRSRVLPAALALSCGVALLPAWDAAVLTSGPLLYSGAYARAGGLSWRGIREAMHRRGEIIFLDEGPDATVTLRRGGGGVLSLQINGKTDASDGGDLPAQALAGEIPAILHRAPRSALVIGLASGITAGALARYPIENLVCVELSPGVARAAQFFKASNGNVLDDPRFHLVLGDGRAYLQETQATFDLIVSQPTNPWIAGVTNLFTREFFQTARAHLSSGGILAVWVQGYAFRPVDFRSLVATFQDVFPEAQLWEESAGGGDYYLLGQSQGSGPLLRSIMDKLSQSSAERVFLENAGIREPADFLARFIASGAALRRFASDAPRITDDNVRIEYTAPREIWSNRLPELLASLEAIREPPDRLFPELLDPTGEPLRASLSLKNRERQDRLRLALSIRRQDLEALASPSLAAALKLIQSGRSTEALPFLTRAREEAPEAGVVPLLLGWHFLRAGSAVQAEGAFRQAATMEPDSPEAWQGLGLSLYRLDRLSEAGAAFLRAVALAPGDADPLANLGAVRVAEQRYAEALPLLDQALKLNPGHLSGRINRGVALAREGRLEEAIREYQLALSQDPGNDDARYNLERARERLRETSKASP